MPASMIPSEIRHHDGGTTLIGPDAILYAQAIHVKVALGLHIKSAGRMRMTRTASPTSLLALSTGITKKKYKRGQYQQAIDDLQTWIDTMRAALPHTDERTNTE